MNYLKQSIFVVLTILFVSCGKYEEGPGLSLRTKKARLTGSWKEHKYISVLGVETLAQNNAPIHIFEKDDTYRYSSSGVLLNGMWEFMDDKNYIRYYASYPILGNVITDWRIIRLTNKELWIETNTGRRIFLVK